MEKWQDWEVDMHIAHDRMREDIRRTAWGWIAAGLSVFIALGFVAWVASVV